MYKDIIKTPKGIIFDMGDTVFETYDNDLLQGNREILKYSNNPNNLTAEGIQNQIRSFVDATFSKRDTSLLEVNFQAFQRLLFESLDITFNKSASEIAEIFCLTAFKRRPIADIDQLLLYLQSHDIKTGILSNSSFSGDTLVKELDSLHLASYFSFIMSSCDYSIRKPHKLIFDLAIKKMGLACEDIWFIGDTYEADIIGADKAGILPIWFNWKNNYNNSDVPHIEIKNISELLTLLKDLEDQENESAS